MISAAPSSNATRNLPLSDPRCDSDSCLAFKAAHALSQAQVSYAHQYEYGHWVTWFYLGIIGVCTAVYVLKRFDVRVLDTAVSTWRFLAYRRPKHRLIWIIPSAGMMLLFSVSFLLLAVASFVIHPYYRDRRGYGSPPLAVRTGVMATALTPIIVALGGKFNLITLLTGISHERLNIIHRFSSWMCLILSIIHTVPFIYQPLHEGGYKFLQARYARPKSFELSGTPPLAILVGIVFFSLPWFRHRFYETFYHVHILFYIAYLGLMFWHCGDELDSWVYLWATLGIWITSVLGRVLFKTSTINLRRPWFESLPATVTVYPDRMVRVQIPAPWVAWTAGQHMFVRIPAISILDNHPFTIASAPQAKPQDNKLVFLVRVHDGFTRQLYEHATRAPKQELQAWLDGPYGGISERIARYDNLVLVAGGSGVSAVLPFLDSNVTQCSITLIWAVRTRSALQWTDFAQNKGDSEKPEPEPAETTVQVRANVTVRVFVTSESGRPELGSLVPMALSPGRNLIVGCGPVSMQADLANAAARAQFASVEVALHLEKFGW